MLALSLALTLGAVVVDQDPVGATEPPSFQFAAIPMVSYGSDVGVTAGGATFLYRDGEVVGRYERLSLSGSFATRGPRSFNFQWDTPTVAASRWGLMLDVRLGDDTQAPYWGDGGRLGGSLVPPGAGAAPEPYRFHSRGAFAVATVRPLPGPGIRPYARARLLVVDVRERSVLLALEQPPGSGGGASMLWEAGLVLDTRDRDVGTRRGAYASASMFAAPAVGPLGPGSFAGFDVAASGYWPVTAWATLAAHMMVDAKLGDVPFFERSHYEGIAYGGGLGGAGTVRGLARLRMVGEEKALASLELRVAAWEGRLRAGKPLQLGFAIGSDTGVVRQRGYPAMTALGGFAGVRALWDRAVLFRFEVGYAGQGDVAMYLVTGEQF